MIPSKAGRLVPVDPLKRIRFHEVVAVIQHRHFITACFIAAFIIRLSWILGVNPQPVSDFLWYYERGLDFTAGYGYSVGPEAYWPENIPPRVLEIPSGRSPTAYWPVGYPAFLGLLFSLFGPSLFIAKLANLGLYLGVLFFSYYISKTLFASDLAGRISLLSLAFYPDHIAYTSLLSSEILFLFLLLAGITLLIVPRYLSGSAFIAGIVFGLACLVKPQAVFVPAIFFVLAFIGQKEVLTQLKLALVVHIALGLTILPWLVRNYQTFDTLTLSHNGGYNLLVGNNPYATGSYVFNKQLVAMLSEAQTEPERDKKAAGLALDYIFNHPVKTLRLWPKKLWELYQDDTKGLVWNERGLKAGAEDFNPKFFTALKIVAQLYYMLIGATFFLSVLVLIRLRKVTLGHHDLGLWVMLYFTFVSLVTFGNSRFHFMMIPWMVIYMGLLVELLVKPEQSPIALITNPMRRFMWN